MLSDSNTTVLKYSFAVSKSVRVRDVSKLPQLHVAGVSRVIAAVDCSDV